MVWRGIFSVRVNFRNFHSVHSWNQIVIKLITRNFCQIDFTRFSSIMRSNVICIFQAFLQNLCYAKLLSVTCFHEIIFNLEDLEENCSIFCSFFPKAANYFPTSNMWSVIFYLRPRVSLRIFHFPRKSVTSWCYRSAKCKQKPFDQEN